ncbi:MAG: T9SS type A sorting domain-containing protein [Bacteroidetes bacterium]|nr:T9SS type A sorting domain-containing protein [Bacteroidota bacterium]
MMDLFADHYAGTPNGPTGAEGQVFRDVLVEALLVDDNDADLSNGTPNDQDIACAFGRHGITLITDVDSVHAELLTHIANDPIPMTADNSYPWYYNGADIHYKVNPSGSWNVVAMTDTMNQFEGFIPGQPAGSIIYYYLSFDDICNNRTAYPQGVDAASNPNIPYVIMVGFYEHDLQDFDNFNSGWTIGDAADGATTGVWEIASPVASYTNVSNKIPANLVQTGTDHTPNDNNNFCAVTGNAATSNIIQGNNDVDGGATTLYSPVYDLTGFQNPAFDYYRWYTNNTGNSPNNDFWKVQVSNDGTNWSTIENILVTDRSWRHYGFRVGDYILPSSTTSIRFIAADFPAGSIVEAAIDDLRLWDIVEKVSSTEDISVDYSIYPNPSNGNFVLELGNVPVSLSLYNTLGQQVKQPVVVNAFEKYVINASDLDAGVYLLRLEAEGQLYFEKLMLIKE